ncbi:shootin-1-like [Corticium candelabrum]|uniref:shootin-1-like n=1 Tax=Corticium candelabrum TaxID=121492 RepID=UPI002E25D231|nr:shootin-1-like [Corticium candelabrum]
MLVFDHGYGQDAEDLYEDIAANTTPQQRQTSPLQKQSLPPPSTPAPPPPGSPPPPPPPDMEDLECYDDVSVGGHLVEEDLYEELDA